MSEQPAYKFRWSNVDLDAYVKGLKAKATMLRRDAQLLVTRAEQIEIVADDLSMDLIKEHIPEEAEE